MSETPSRGTGPSAAPPVGDPWAAFGYLVAGVLFYGVIGWLLSSWLHASYWFPIGVLVGAAFGMYLVFSRYRFHGDGADGQAVTLLPPIATPATDLSPRQSNPSQPPPNQPPPTGIHTARPDRTDLDQSHDMSRFHRPARDDQGEMS